LKKKNAFIDRVAAKGCRTQFKNKFAKSYESKNGKYFLISDILLMNDSYSRLRRLIYSGILSMAKLLFLLVSFTNILIAFKWLVKLKD